MSEQASIGSRRAAPGAGALLGGVFSGVVLSAGVSLSACGDYDPPTSPGAAGSNVTSGQLNPAAPAASAGAGGGAGQSPLVTGAGGSAPAATGAGSGAAGSAASGAGGGGSVVTPVQASCNGVVPCGGDVVGTWVVAGSCLPVSGNADMSGFGLGCTAAPVAGMLEVDGTWTATAGGFTDQTTTAGSSEIQLPPDCLNVSGTTTTCDRVDGALEALGYSSVACTNAASGGCTCTASVQQTGGLGFVSLEASTTGMLSAANDVVTLSARSTTEYSYCVSGATLTLSPRSMGRTGTLAGTIVLQKQ